MTASMLAFLVSIVNLSLSIVSFPTHLKSSFVTLLLKMPSLGKDTPSNYRPIFNLSVISNITKWSVKECLLKHLTSNSLLNLNQFTFYKHHSIETTLLHDHLSNAVSHQQISNFCLLSLFAAFDTICHSILYNTKHKKLIRYCYLAYACGFGVSRIEPLSSPAFRKRRLMEASRGLPAGAIPSVVKV